MATTIDELQVLISANADKFQSEINKVNTQLGNMSKSADKAHAGLSSSFRGISASAVAMGSIASSVFQKIAQVVIQNMGAAVTRLDTIKNYPRVMSALGFSVDDANASVKALEQGVLGLPTSLDAIVSSAQQLATVSPTLDSATQRALALNDALLAGGQGQEAASRAAFQFNQMLATGIADMQSWRSVVMTMPGQMKQLAQSMLGAGASTNDLQQAIVDGKLSVQQLADQLVILDKQGYANFASFRDQAVAATGGVGTAMSNVNLAIVRGLANIMDAIGQSNITAFFNAIASAINAVIPYVIAAVVVIGDGINFIASALGSVFGSGANSAAKSVASNADAAAASMSNVASGAGAAASGINSAADAAKKMKNSLAGFDQMNVITQQDSGASAGGGAGANTGSALTKFDTNKATEATGAIDAMKNAIEDFKKAFKNSPFGSAFIAGFKAVGEALKWFYDSVLVPLGKWVGDNVFKPITDFFKKVNGDGPATATALQVIGYVLGILAAAMTVAVAAFVAWNAIVLIWTAVSWAAGVATAAFGAAINFLMSPVILIIAGIVALIAIVYLLITHWDTVKQVAQAAWDYIVQATGVFVKSIGDFFAGMWNGIVSFFGGIGKWFGDRFTEAWTAVSGAFKSAGQFFSAIWTNITGAFATVGKWFGDIFAGAWDAVKNAFSSVTGFFRGVWDSIVSIFGKVGTAVGDAIGGGFKAIINTVIDLASNTINGFIRLINGAIDIINKIPGVNIGKISELRLPRLATGGITQGATAAIIGEAGREAVLPLDANTGWMDTLAGKINGNGQPIQLTVKIGDDTLIDKVVDGINNTSFMRGANIISI